MLTIFGLNNMSQPVKVYSLKPVSLQMIFTLVHLNFVYLSLIFKLYLSLMVFAVVEND